MQIKVTKEIIENAYELYLRGYSYAEISRQMGGTMAQEKELLLLIHFH